MAFTLDSQCLDSTYLGIKPSLNSISWAGYQKMNYDWQEIQKWMNTYNQNKHKSKSFWEKAALQFNLEE